MSSNKDKVGVFTFSLLVCSLWLVLASLLDFLLQEGWGIVSGLAAMFFSIFWGFLGGLGLGMLLLLVLRGQEPVKWIISRGLSIWSFLTEKNPSRATALVSHAIGALIWLASVVVISFILNKQVAAQVARIHFQALLSTMVVLGASFVLLPLGVVAQRLVEVVSGLIHRWTGISIFGRRALWSLLVGFSGFLVVVGWALVKNIETVLLSPWQTPVQLAVALLASLVFTVFGLKLLRFPWFFRISSAVAVGLLVVSGSAAVSLPVNDAATRGLFQGGRCVSLTWGGLNKLLDFDDDGFMSAFAGGDCSPRNPEINPGAIDIPDNGLDEDCSGDDVKDVGRQTARWDYPVHLGDDWKSHDVPVFIITSDALSANHVSYMGYVRKTTPNLDKLSRRCVRFDKAFSQGPSTRISLPSFFTSRWDTQTVREPVGKNPYPFAPQNLTMAEVFKRNGYDTVAVVPKWYFTTTWKGILQGFSKVDKSPIKHYKEKSNQIHNAKWVTKAAISHIRKARTKPLFMWVHYYDVHFPYRKPKGVEPFGDERVDIYDTELKFWDQQFYPLVREIEKTYGDTGYILILTSDHGSSFDPKHHPKHANGYDLYTSTLHIPMLWCSPVWEPRVVDETPVSLLDILPTLVNILDLNGRFRFEGTSLVPFLDGNNGPEWRDRVVFHQFFLFEKTIRNLDPLFKAGVRSGRFNYIWDREQDKRELYDYVEDPFENHNLIDEMPELADGFHSMIQSWLFRVHQRYNPSWQKPEQGEDESGESGEDG